jgi:hypothetical protein
MPRKDSGNYLVAYTVVKVIHADAKNLGTYFDLGCADDPEPEGVVAPQAANIAVRRLVVTSIQAGVMEARGGSRGGHGRTTLRDRQGWLGLPPELVVLCTTRASLDATPSRHYFPRTARPPPSYPAQPGVNRTD